MNDVEVQKIRPSEHFFWHTIDLRTILPRDWQSEIIAFADRHAENRVIIPVSVTSREQSTSIRIPVHFIGGTAVTREFSWLHDMYYGAFREAVQLVCPEPVLPAKEINIGINLNMQRGNVERYECHVDSCPLTVLLYATDHPAGTGGDLMVANRGDVRGREEVDADASRIHPVSGHLVVFDARRHTHYVAPLTAAEAVRVVLAMSYYTPSCPEELRPTDLDHHLGLD